MSRDHIPLGVLLLLAVPTFVVAFVLLVSAFAASRTAVGTGGVFLALVLLMAVYAVISVHVS